MSHTNSRELAAADITALRHRLAHVARTQRTERSAKDGKRADVYYVR